MELVSRKDDEYRFEHSINGSFVNHGAVIRVDRSGRVLGIALNSARLGTALWEAERGLIECRAWESDTDLEQVSFLARHYQAALTGRKEGSEFAAMILKDCIAATRNQYLNEILQAVCGDGRTSFLDPTAFDAVQAQLPPEPPSNMVERILARRAAIKAEYRARMDEEARRIQEEQTAGRRGSWVPPSFKVTLGLLRKHTNYDRLRNPVMVVLSLLILWLVYENVDLIESWFE